LGSPAGSQALDALFEGGPSLEWQADVGWIARAGADPVAAVEARRDRLTSVHLKDLAPPGHPGEAGWADVGAGTLPRPALARAAPRPRPGSSSTTHRPTTPASPAPRSASCSPGAPARADPPLTRLPPGRRFTAIA
jgi:hypothetical protein